MLAMLVWKGNYYKKGTTECYVMFHHSSQDLGHGSNKHYGFVYTKALLAEACG